MGNFPFLGLTLTQAPQGQQLALESSDFATRLGYLLLGPLKDSMAVRVCCLSRSSRAANAF